MKANVWFKRQIGWHQSNLALQENGTVIIDTVDHNYANFNYSAVTNLDNSPTGTLNNITIRNEKAWNRTVFHTLENQYKTNLETSIKEV